MEHSHPARAVLTQQKSCGVIARRCPGFCKRPYNLRPHALHPMTVTNRVN